MLRAKRKKVSVNLSAVWLVPTCEYIFTYVCMYVFVVCELPAAGCCLVDSQQSKSLHTLDRALARQPARCLAVSSDFISTVLLSNVIISCLPILGANNFVSFPTLLLHAVFFLHFRFCYSANFIKKYFFCFVTRLILYK